MSAITATAPGPVPPRPAPAGCVRFIRDTALLTVRSLRAVPARARAPARRHVQPIIFILLFLYVFGSAIHVPGVSYKDYLFPGIIGQSLAFGIIGAGVATSHDMTEGVIDRFRSMPISRLSIITAQVMGQFCEQMLGIMIVVLFGLIARVDATPHRALHGIELVALIVPRDVRLHLDRRPARNDRPLARRDAGRRLHRRLPARLHGRDVRPDRRSMDAVPRTIAQWDPISALVASVRNLTEGMHVDRLLAARPSGARDGPVVPVGRRGLRPARAAALQPQARRLRLRSPADNCPGVLGSNSELFRVTSQTPSRRRSRSSRGGARPS